MVESIGNELTLNNGVTMPALGLGVFQSAPEETAAAVEAALRTGYRHIDSAAAYGNERQVGEGIRRSGVDREEVFVETKVWVSDYGRDKTLHAFDKAVGKLGFATIDLLILHQPAPDRFDTTVAAYQALEQLLADGRVRAIGVSNFTPQHLADLFERTEVVPAVNQVELHPYFAQRELQDVNASHGILTQAWSPIGGITFYPGWGEQRRSVLEDDTIAGIASALGRSPAQVMLRWHLQQGRSAIPKSTNPERIAQNFDVFDFELDAEQLAAIDALDTGERTGPDPDVPRAALYERTIPEDYASRVTAGAGCRVRDDGDHACECSWRRSAHRPRRGTLMATRPIRFGVLAPIRSDMPTWLDEVRRIADTGFSTLLMPDVRQWQPAPAPTLAVAATLTDLRVGTWVYASPLRPAWQLAWEAHSLTTLTEGRFEMGIGTGRPGMADELVSLGLPVRSPGERLAEVRATVEALRSLDGDAQQHTPVAMAVRGPKALALAAGIADIVTFAAMPDDTRATVTQLAQDVRGACDAELAAHVSVVGDAVAPFMTPPTTDPAALHAADSLSALPGDPAAATEEILRRREEIGFSYFVVGANAVATLAPVVAELAGT